MQTSLIAKCTETRHTCAPNTFVLSALLQLLLPRVLVGINFWQFYLVVDAVCKRSINSGSVPDISALFHSFGNHFRLTGTCSQTSVFLNKSKQLD